MSVVDELLEVDGLDWLRTLSSGWEAIPLKRLARIKYGLGQPPRLLDGGLPLIRATNVNRGKITPQDLVFVDPDDVPYERDPILRTDDIIVVRSGAYTGDSAIIPREYDGAISGYDMVVRATKADPRFIAFSLLSIPVLHHQIDLCRLRAAQPHLNAEELGETILCVPPLPEQRAIAGFLDRKTAQIDAVVAKKQRLIERLQEKRQALISHAVTKGLNPHAPMKDSGIEWLKEVPAHWMVRRFRHCGTIPNGQVDPRLPAYRDMVLIAPNHIESETGRLLLTETAFEQGAESGKYVAQKCDVIYSKIRPELQKACIAPVRCLCSADMYPITPKPDMVAEYILYNLLCDWFTKYAVLWSDRVAMPKVNRETFGNCFMVVPPLDEQKRIVRYITTQTEHIDRMTDRIRTQIAKLQEYRQTLISAAVTGKINVGKEAAHDPH